MPVGLFKDISRKIFSGSAPKRFNVLILGQDDFSCSILTRLYSVTDLWDGIWIATNPDARTGRRGKDLAVSPLKVLARSKGLPAYVVPSKQLGMKTWEVPGPFSVTVNDPHNVLITASFGRVIPARILNMFNHSRRFNVHPSLVPLYRGPAPIQHAIADGCKQTGVSVLSLEPISNGIDSGVVWGSQTVDISPDTTFHSLREALAETGGDLLVSVLRGVAAGTITPVPQDSTRATMAPFIRRQFVQIDWGTWDAQRLDRVHRAAHHQHALVALLPYSLTLKIKQFKIRCPMSLNPRLKEPGESIYDPETQSIIIRCARQTEISATLLQQENKSVLGAGDFWNGIRPKGLEEGILKLRSVPS